jgi:hypothetical protein
MDDSGIPVALRSVMVGSWPEVEVGWRLAKCPVTRAVNPSSPGTTVLFFNTEVICSPFFYTKTAAGASLVLIGRSVQQPEEIIRRLFEHVNNYFMHEHFRFMSRIRGFRQGDYPNIFVKRRGSPGDC